MSIIILHMNGIPEPQVPWRCKA